MKQLKLISFLILGLGICAGLAIGINKLVTRTEKVSADRTVACAKKGSNHLVIMHNNSTTSNNIFAKLCDTLTIKNIDDQIRLVAFGEHEHHQAYDGVLERPLDKNQGLTVTLNQAGTFKFHDHLDDSAHGVFTVQF